MSDQFNDGQFVTRKVKTRKGLSKGAVFFIVIIVLAVAGVAALSIFGDKLTSLFSSTKANTEMIQPAIPGKFKFGNFSKFSGNKYVAELYITGVIQDKNKTYNQEWLLNTISMLSEDPDNAGILLVIDSPGGTVYEADEAYLALRKYKNTGKQIWAYFKQISASGGYYIGCAADNIYANRNTLTGSIGVIAGQSFDATEFLSKMGIKSKTFTAGKNKNMLNYNSVLTPEQEQIMQSIADDAYDQFTEIVSQSRKMDMKTVKALADGRIYTAHQAKENGLIDLILNFEDAKNRIALQISENSEDVDFQVFQYVYDEPMFNRFFSMFTNLTPPEAMIDPATRTIIKEALPDIKYPAYLYK